MSDREVPTFAVGSESSVTLASFFVEAGDLDGGEHPKQVNDAMSDPSMAERNIFI